MVSDNSDYCFEARYMNIRVIVLTAIAASISLASPAQAINFDEILKNYLGVARPGSQDISAQEQAIIKTNVNTRQAQLETEIQAGVQSGQLTTEEENDLKNELNSIAALEGNYLSDGNYNRVEVQSMLDRLNTLALKLQTYLSNGTSRIAATTPDRSHWYRRHLAGPRDGDLRNSQAFQADIDTRQAQLDSAISSGISSGRLSWNESQSLRAELNTIAENEKQYTANGRLSYTEAQQLITQLEALNARLERDLNDYDKWRRSRRGKHQSSSRQVDSHQSLLRQRIEGGMRSGQLTRSEAYRLMSEEARIAELETKLRGESGRLSFDEQRKLFSQLDDLSRKINKELTDHQVQ